MHLGSEKTFLGLLLCPLYSLHSFFTFTKYLNGMVKLLFPRVYAICCTLTFHWCTIHLSLWKREELPAFTASRKVNYMGERGSCVQRDIWSCMGGFRPPSHSQKVGKSTLSQRSSLRLHSLLFLETGQWCFLPQSIQFGKGGGHLLVKLKHRYKLNSGWRHDDLFCVFCVFFRRLS